MKKIGIVAALCFAFALCFTLVGCGGVDKSLYTGTWSLESGNDESLDAESISLMKTLGLEVKLTLNEDETGTMDLIGDIKDVTWKATSDTEGEITLDGATAALSLADGKLTITDSNGMYMTFVKSSDTASASAAAASASAASAESASAEAADDAADEGDAAEDGAVGDEAAEDEGEGEES